jgi:hypothetical protein
MNHARPHLLGMLQDAEQGIFQIVPRHGTDTSSEGLNDVSSRQKTITAVATVTFLLK